MFRNILLVSLLLSFGYTQMIPRTSTNVTLTHDQRVAAGCIGTLRPLFESNARLVNTFTQNLTNHTESSTRAFLRDLQTTQRTCHMRSVLSDHIIDQVSKWAGIISRSYSRYENDYTCRRYVRDLVTSIKHFPRSIRFTSLEMQGGHITIKNNHLNSIIHMLSRLRSRCVRK